MSMQIPQDASSAQASAPILQRIGQFFVKLFTWPARLSLPGKIAFITSIMLIVLAAVVWLIILNDPKHVHLYHVLTPTRIAVILALIVIIPILVYYGLRLWLQGERSAYPEIDFAWNAGIEALAENGMTLDSVPVFLVVGSSTEDQERAIMNASGRSFRVNCVPEGPAPLHWYGNPNGVYLFCTDVGALSSLASLMSDSTTTGDQEFIPINVEPAPAPQPPPPSAVAKNQPVAAGAGAHNIRGTISLDQLQQSQAEMPGAAGTPEGGGAGIKGTMVLQPLESSTAVPGQQMPSVEQNTPAPPAATPAGRSRRKDVPSVLPTKVATEQRRRLQYVARKLVHAREPLCPANGILTLLPFESIAAGSVQAEELEKAVRSDLGTLQQTLELRCPVTALVAGFEEEPGFAELVRRVGPERAQVQRFGRGFDLRNIAVAEELFGFCSHVTGAFEDWVYTLFREQDALLRPGNTRLYGLLCRVRFKFKAKLAEILADGFGVDPQRQPEGDAVLFSGCYFAATGATQDRQAFVRGVFDKLEDEQESIEWTSQAMIGHTRRRRLAAAGLAVSILLTVSLVGMIVYAQ